MEGFMLRQITLLHEFVNEYRKGVIGLNRLIERIESIRAVIDPPALKDELANHQLENYRFAFSVPASFEANQRRDLMKSLNENGIDEK